MEKSGVKIQHRMPNWTGLVCIGALTLCLLAGCQQASTPAVIAAHVASSPQPQPAANFDYYLLTLSWSPEYCHGHGNSPQCSGDHPGFVVHGLWPQFNSGQWPSDCSRAAGLADPSTMLDIMPDPRLIAHEWAKHGTCSGLTANQYFALVRQAYDSIKVPASLVSPSRTATRSTSDIKHLFSEANPAISADDMAVSCHNRYLSAVEFCLSKELRPIACQAVRDCNARAVRIPSIQ